MGGEGVGAELQAVDASKTRNYSTYLFICFIKIMSPNIILAYMEGTIVQQLGYNEQGNHFYCIQTIVEGLYHNS